MDYSWFTSQDARLKDNILRLLHTRPVSLPTAEQFCVEPKFFPRICESRPHGLVQPFAPYGKFASLSPPRQRSSREPRPPTTPSTTSELTLTYIGIVRRSEDFNRRAIMKDELRLRSSYVELLNAFQHMIPVLQGEMRSFFAQEHNARCAVQRESDDAFSKLAASGEQSFTSARRKEGSRPNCYGLPLFKGAFLSESACERAFVELSWRGGVDLTLAAVVVAHSGVVLGVATDGEGVRGKGRVLLVRPLNDYDGNCGNGVGGSRITFQLNLNCCPVTVSSIIFVVCPRGNSQTLSGLRQCWLTVSDLSREGEMRQLLTIFVSPLSFYGVVIAASLRQKSERLWQYFHEGGTLLGHRRPAVVAQVFSERGVHHLGFIGPESEYVFASLMMKECEELECCLRSWTAETEAIDRHCMHTTLLKLRGRRAPFAK